MKSFVLAICSLAIAGAAAASPCGQKVEALQARFGALHPTGAAAPATNADEAETTSAKLHHQPTAASVAGAEQKADTASADRAAHFQVEIEEAKAAADSGDESGCETAAREAEKSLAP